MGLLAVQMTSKHRLRSHRPKATEGRRRSARPASVPPFSARVNRLGPVEIGWLAGLPADCTPTSVSRSPSLTDCINKTDQQRISKRSPKGVYMYMDLLVHSVRYCGSAVFATAGDATHRHPRPRCLHRSPAPRRHTKRLDGAHTRGHATPGQRCTTHNGPVAIIGHQYRC